MLLNLDRLTSLVGVAGATHGLHPSFIDNALAQKGVPAETKVTHFVDPRVRVGSPRGTSILSQSNGGTKTERRFTGAVSSMVNDFVITGAVLSRTNYRWDIKSGYAGTWPEYSRGDRVHDHQSGGYDRSDFQIHFLFNRAGKVYAGILSVQRPYDYEVPGTDFTFSPWCDRCDVATNDLLWLSGMDVANELYSVLAQPQELTLVGMGNIVANLKAGRRPLLVQGAG